MTGNGPVKRSITIAGHRTSLSLEDEFWSALKDISDRNDRSLAETIAEVDAARGDRNLSSALRVYILSNWNQAN